MAGEVQLDSQIKEHFKNDSVLDVIPPTKVSKNINTPYAVRLILNNRSTPTCGLLEKRTNKWYEMIGPSEDSEFGNCHARLKKPMVVNAKNGYYAVYEYEVEDPKKEFNKAYQVVQLNEGGFVVCKEDGDLNHRIESSIERKVNIKAAAKYAIEKLGCTPVKEKSE